MTLIPNNNKTTDSNGEDTGVTTASPEDKRAASEIIRSIINRFRLNSNGGTKRGGRFFDEDAPAEHRSGFHYHF